VTKNELLLETIAAIDAASARLNDVFQSVVLKTDGEPRSGGGSEFAARWCAATAASCAATLSGYAVSLSSSNAAATAANARTAASAIRQHRRRAMAMEHTRVGWFACRSECGDRKTRAVATRSTR